MAMTVAQLTGRKSLRDLFKWIKQNLKVKTFLGTSQNAVLMQRWIALCVYIQLCFFKFVAKIKGSISEILRILQLNLF
ncbi:MAG: hypothetical protein CR992_00685 [Desulfobacterales bacterium]|nr:MAG: hypothetical protein CR992_00685 [Desulfobacterales bacterium]